jgi:hypothetical protein
MVVKAYNPSYSGGRNQEDCDSTTDSKPTISTKKRLGVMVCACHLNYTGSINRRIVVQAGWDINVRPYSKK